MLALGIYRRYRFINKTNQIIQKETDKSEELVKSVDFYFSKFDEIIKKYDLEKIKTIGDAYMCAGGLPFPTTDHADKMIQAALEIAEFTEESKK